MGVLCHPRLADRIWQVLFFSGLGHECCAAEPLAQAGPCFAGGKGSLEQVVAFGCLKQSGGLPFRPRVLRLDVQICR